MNIQKTVKVLYKEYKVEQEENIHDEDGDLYGQVRFLEEIIVLNAAASDRTKEATLVHELVHALDDMYRINLEEEQVEKLGNALYMLISDNPELFETNNT